jgi:solute carrier family 25 carnitine/acylcarnitine transporter 20/29
MFQFKEYLCGNIFGISQIIIGYPFDTIKTNIQNGQSIKFLLHNPKLLYRGVTGPLVMTSFGTSIMFGNYEYFCNKTNNNFLGGILTGLISSFIITPFDYRKNYLQTSRNIITKLSSNSQLSLPQLIKLYYTGLGYTIARETISIPVYFNTYEYLSTITNHFIAGGIAGMTSWFITYPIDTMKTRKQLNTHLNIQKLFKQGNYYQGITITLLRAFIVNASGFYLYEFVKQTLNKY